MKIFVVGFAVCSALFAAKPLYFRAPRTLLTPEFRRSSGWNPDHVHDDEFQFGYVLQERYDRLDPVRKSFLLPVNEAVLRHHRFDPKSLELLDPDEKEEPVKEGYHTYETLTTELKNFATKYPKFVTLKSAGKTVKGREMWYVVLTSPVEDENKPKILLASSMHGDEVVGKELMIYLARLLLDNYGKEARLTSMLDHSSLYIMPSVNPDGTALQQRENANGVDLNRDFPDLDESPFDQNRAVETRQLMQLHRENFFVTSLNFHTGDVVFNMPWDSKANQANMLFGDDKLVNFLARGYADSNSEMHANNSSGFDRGVTYGYEWYQVLGGMQDWADYFLGHTHATVELSHTKSPSASKLPGYWEENRESLLTFIENSMTGIHLKVVDMNSNLIPVDVLVSTANRWIKYDGFVNRTTVNEMQSVTLRASGRADKTFTLKPMRFNGFYQTIVMD